MANLLGPTQGYDKMWDEGYKQLPDNTVAYDSGVSGSAPKLSVPEFAEKIATAAGYKPKDFTEEANKYAQSGDIIKGKGASNIYASVLSAQDAFAQWKAYADPLANQGKPYESYMIWKQGLDTEKPMIKGGAGGTRKLTVRPPETPEKPFIEDPIQQNPSDLEEIKYGKLHEVPIEPVELEDTLGLTYKNMTDEEVKNLIAKKSKEIEIKKGMLADKRKASPVNSLNRGKIEGEVRTLEGELGALKKVVGRGTSDKFKIFSLEQAEMVKEETSKELEIVIKELKQGYIPGKRIKELTEKRDKLQERITSLDKVIVEKGGTVTANNTVAEATSTPLPLSVSEIPPPILDFTTPPLAAEEVSNGLLEKGTVDLSKQPVVANEDGSISTVSSKSFEFDGIHYLLPTISQAGKRLSDNEVIEKFKLDGLHLGSFSSSDAATKYAQNLSLVQGYKHGEGKKAVKNAGKQIKSIVSGMDNFVTSAFEALPEHVAEAIANVWVNFDISKINRGSRSDKSNKEARVKAGKDLANKLGDACKDAYPDPYAGRIR